MVIGLSLEFFFHLFLLAVFCFVVCYSYSAGACAIGSILGVRE